MRIVVSEFMSLDGVVQAPGGPEEDTEGGFAHGGWSMPYFDPEAMGAAIDEAFQAAEALLFGRRTWQVSAAAWQARAESFRLWDVASGELDGLLQRRLEAIGQKRSVRYAVIVGTLLLAGLGMALVIRSLLAARLRSLKDKQENASFQAVVAELVYSRQQFEMVH